MYTVHNTQVVANSVSARATLQDIAGCHEGADPMRQPVDRRMGGRGGAVVLGCDTRGPHDAVRQLVLELKSDRENQVIEPQLDKSQPNVTWIVVIDGSLENQR